MIPAVRHKPRGRTGRAAADERPEPQHTDQTLARVCARRDAPTEALHADPYAGPSADPFVGPLVDPCGGPPSDPSADPCADPCVGPSVGLSGDPSADPCVGPSADPCGDPGAGPFVDPAAGPPWGPCGGHPAARADLVGRRQTARRAPSEEEPGGHRTGSQVVEPTSSDHADQDKGRAQEPVLGSVAG